MASRIVEFFGYNPEDRSAVAVETRRELRCPYLGRQCVKTLSDGLISGACTLKPTNAGPVICCPIRLYAGNYEILRDVARVSFGPVIPLISGRSITDQTGECVAVFGKGWGKELRLPNRGKSGKRRNCPPASTLSGAPPNRHRGLLRQRRPAPLLHALERKEQVRDDGPQSCVNPNHRKSPMKFPPGTDHRTG